MVKRIPLLAATVVVGLIALGSSHPARAQQFRWGAVYQHWTMTEPASNLDTWMWPSMANDAMFFTQVFSIENSGSYMGLQQDGTGGRKVRFSIWNATAFRASTVEGAACRPFGGEGVGMTCTIPYAWETGRWYRLRIRMLDSDTEGQWWGAWVMDDAGRERRVGDIRAPGTGLITSTSTFNEYYGPAEGFPCGQPPPSAVHVYQPLVNDDSSRAAARGGSLLQCSGGRVTEHWNGELARLDLHTERVVGPAPAVPPVAIDLVDGVDLVVHSPRADHEIVAPGTAFTFSADVRNLGTASAASTTLGYYRSTDSTISTTDTRTGSVSIAGLSAAAAASASLGVRAPATVGTHYFGACVDDVPAERNADNNCSAGVPVVVTVDDPTMRSVLVEIYHATGGPTWTTRTNWLSDQPIGTWHGVRTDAAGRVTHLRLPNNGLTGRIPDALRRLPRLEDLRLAGNDLVGPIPAWLETLPLLRELWLDSNRLSGRIPAELGALTRLGHLSLDRNAGLSGPVPAEFGNLTTLWTLRLNHTGLTGPLPLALANLRSLNYMDVRNTGLCAPDDPAFQSWLRTVNVNGGIATCTRPPVNQRPVGVLAPGRTTPPTLDLTCYGYDEGAKRAYACIPEPSQQRYMRTFVPAVGSACDQGSIAEFPAGRIVFQIRCRDGSLGQSAAWWHSGQGPGFFVKPIGTPRVWVRTSFSGSSVHLSVWCRGPQENLVVNELLGTSWGNDGTNGIYGMAGCREVEVDTAGEDLQWWFAPELAATALTPPRSWEQVTGADSALPAEALQDLATAAELERRWRQPGRWQMNPRQSASTRGAVLTSDDDGGTRRDLRIASGPDDRRDALDGGAPLRSATRTSPLTIDLTCHGYNEGAARGTRASTAFRCRHSRGRSFLSVATTRVRRVGRVRTTAFRCRHSNAICGRSFLPSDRLAIGAALPSFRQVGSSFKSGVVTAALDNQRRGRTRVRGRHSSRSRSIPRVSGFAPRSRGVASICPSGAGNRRRISWSTSCWAGRGETTERTGSTGWLAAAKSRWTRGEGRTCSGGSRRIWLPRR